MLYTFYQTIGATLYPLLVLALPLFERFAPHWQLARRLGSYQDTQNDQNDQDDGQAGAGSKNKARLIWIHAASVGEVQAARALISLLTAALPDAEIFLSTMTRQGKAVAQSLLPAQVRCELAPLDIPRAVNSSLRLLRPSLYICLETELWPVMLTTMRKAGVPMLLLNGRISERSFGKYQRIQQTVQQLLTGFTAVGVIQEQDRERFRRLGVPDECIQVCGNMKYDLLPQEKSESASLGQTEKNKKDYARLLHIHQDELVFLCGSTRTGEEELLLPVYLRLREAFSGSRLLWIIAPRHIERLPRVRALLDRTGLEYTLFSRCAQEQQARKEIILLDRMGELACLYAAGDYIFCGGSLVDKGGHNIMEPVAQGKPVFFGPFMQDFQDAVHLVLSAGAGFQVGSPDELTEHLLARPPASPAYKRLCQSADRLARTQQGAAQRQAEMVLRVMENS